MFHSFDGRVVVGFARGDVDEEFAEDAEEGGPEDTKGDFLLMKGREWKEFRGEGAVR